MKSTFIVLFNSLILLVLNLSFFHFSVLCQKKVVTLHCN